MTSGQTFLCILSFLVFSHPLGSFAGYTSIFGELSINLQSGCRLIGNLGRYFDSDGSFYDFAEFLGIPFAEPPVGDLRFRYPVSRFLYDNEYRAVKRAPACIQPIDESFRGYPESIRNRADVWNDRDQSEDCLYLNIWSPLIDKPLGSQKHKELLPVMVWIHGGGFYSGSSSLAVHKGHRLAVLQNVIVVSFNYRVGVFGFLYLHETDAPGNMGLYDQLLAIRWVNANILRFGGDPNKITIFGHNAGAASVGIHLLSPMSSPFFARAILQSGSPTASWAVLSREEMRNRSMIIVNQLGCSNRRSSNGRGSHGSQYSRDIVECLRTHAFMKIDQSAVALWTYKTGRYLPYIVGPVVDGKLLPEHPLKLLAGNKFKKVPIMLGSNRNEGSFWLFYMQPNNLFNVLTQSPISSAQYDVAMQFMFGSLPQPLFEAIKFRYRNWSDPDNVMYNRNSIEAAVGEPNFMCPCNLFAQHYARLHNRVYMYYLDQRSSVESWPDWMGVVHGSECDWVFGKLLDHPNSTAVDKTLARRVMSYWGNFARTSNPNRASFTVYQQEHWKRWETNRQRVLVINSSYPFMDIGPRTDKCALWNAYFPKFVGLYSSNKCPSNFDRTLFMTKLSASQSFARFSVTNTSHGLQLVPVGLSLFHFLVSIFAVLSLVY